MAHSEICPVCRGSGKYYIPPPLDSTLDLSSENDNTCHGCGGKGWVAVRDEPYHPKADSLKDVRYRR